MATSGVMVVQRRFAHGYTIPRNVHEFSAVADEMEELKRELEALKLQLEQERRKNAAADSKPKPERPKSRRQPSGDPKTSTAASASKELRVGYVQHAAVGSRCGKWWLRDRQVLSRATADEDGVATLKVRETWAWSGRMIVLDKIVRLDEEKQQRQPDEVDVEEEEEEEAAEEAELGVKERAEPDATQGLQPSANDAAVEDAVSSEPKTAEQPSEAAETSEPATTSAEEALDSSSAGMGEEASASAKAGDEVRESSVTEPQADEASDAPGIA